MTNIVANAKEFGKTILKTIEGEIPEDIQGNYFRNGPGLLSIGNNSILEHWFMGDGCILSLSFLKGECTAQLKFAETTMYKNHISSKSLSRSSMIVGLWKKWKEGSQNTNPANTSILCLKGKESFLATCEGGQPFLMNKENLNSEGFTDFGWMKSAFSAHPKVDPKNGDIFNIGMSFPNMNIMRADKDMKRINETQFKLRQLQSIHDFCLAGDYLVLFEAPLRFNLKDMFWSNKGFFHSQSFDDSLSTLVHIYKKDSLKHVKTFGIEPFYSFHFTNGYNNDKEIVVEYVKYDTESSKTLWKFLGDVPKFSLAEPTEEYHGRSYLEQLTININDFSTTKKSVKINGDFPVCEDHEVGSNWKYTYVIGSEADSLFKFNTIYKYDRENQKLDKRSFEDSVYLNETCIIRTAKNLYLMSVVNKDRRSYVYIFSADTLETICQLELPEFVPAGFHGKWDSERA